MSSVAAVVEEMCLISLNTAKKTFVAWETQKTSPHRLHSEVPLAKNKQNSERFWRGKGIFVRGTKMLKG